MKLRIVNIGIVVAVVSAFAANNTSAQETRSKRNFEAEIQAAIQSAKTAAGFEHLGTLVRTCLLPQSGGQKFCGNRSARGSHPPRAPARGSWDCPPPQGLDKLYFFGR